LGGLFFALFRFAVTATPALVLAEAAWREGVRTPAGLALAVGAGVQLAIAALVMAYYRTWAPSPGPTTLVCYLISLGWLWFTLPDREDDWFLHLAQAVLVVTPLVVVAAYTMVNSGAILYRRSLNLARRVQGRGNWPRDLSQCRNLPDVKALRESLGLDAGPALQLLRDPRPEVRVAALAALEFRKSWRAGQAEMVLAVLQNDTVPEVRAAAAMALANVNDRQMLEVVADALRDPDPRVRRAAADALFWDSDRRWAWVRYGVRRALSEPALMRDGPMLGEGEKLSPEAVKDFTAWAAEKGILSQRAAETLAVHYARVLHEDPEQTLPLLRQTVQDPHAAPLLRIELTRLLCQSRSLDAKALEALLDPANPAPLRLLATEALLEAGPHIRAIGTLREIARLPNREIALATADVVQRQLGVDLGLALGQPLPPLNSPRAVEVTRRLMAWASRPEYAENVLEGGFPSTGMAARIVEE
jgi:hypothetical protein